jgi:hypothetical protein
MKILTPSHADTLYATSNSTTDDTCNINLKRDQMYELIPVLVFIVSRILFRNGFEVSFASNAGFTGLVAGIEPIVVVIIGITAISLSIKIGHISTYFDW